MKYSILKTIKMARFVIGRFKVLKKLTYLFIIIIIGIVYKYTTQVTKLCNTFKMSH